MLKLWYIKSTQVTDVANSNNDIYTVVVGTVTSDECTFW
jgi:hypothetical protein